ncbi:hypothetical protein CHGG_08630 [Chaetomium globosum CBS 148.51]|uniref:RING-type domain-containing protein n=1 Tax=Chaetomium globosum (strain ATCC 6205 / CBS 148.51 / DSM 1962 / NBRC 6347 / NRRL 1970) TaxID=306901 RepID=Q2GTS4_CHAGB|nr:uncharacterized protein CHGG_08630 [Chaetomium globosum CBS 148.51]EAQ84616.1 hypothetical protein CHGG_08630 [Chaetomium globosum CBS 148.51]
MTETCKACHDPLSLTLDPEDSGAEDSEETVPDDVLLPCGCHFHWQCLLNFSSTITSTLTCPSCNRHLPSNAPTGGGSSSSASAPPPTSTNPVILTHYTNEGGIQPSLDIYPFLTEETFLDAHPEARPARALHTLAAEGEVQGMVNLLTDADMRDEDEDDGDEEGGEAGEGEGGDQALSSSQLLTWRDPLNGGRSALHVALEARQEEVVWLVLWLGSGARREDFPEAVVQVALAMGLPRRVDGAGGEGGEDVRFVRDEAGRTAGDVCLELGQPWARLVEGGVV